jgi:hypothetical protein
MPDQEAPRLTLSNQQHWSYRHYVIHSEQLLFCLDKLIPEALPLLEAPPVVCLVHLKLLCGFTFDRSHIFKCFISQCVVKAGNSKNSHGAVCVYICGWSTCGTWNLANIRCISLAKCTGALWFATQRTAISRCERRTASRRRLIATKLNAGSQFGLL